MTLSFDLLQTQAVLIGNSEYPSDPKGLPALPSVKNNIDKLWEILADPKIVGLPEKNISLIRERESNTVASGLARICGEARQGLIVYYAGHGLVGDNGKLFLATRDSTHAHLDYNSLEFQKVKKAIHDSPASQKILILDCCYSGRAFDHGLGPTGGNEGAVFPIQGAFTMAACRGYELAFAPKDETYTLFTGELIWLLENGIRMHETRGITLKQVFEQIRHELSKNPNLPEPQKGSFQFGGDLVFALNRAFPSLLKRIQAQRQRFSVGYPQASQAATSLLLEVEKGLGALEKDKLEGIRNCIENCRQKIEYLSPNVANIDSFRDLKNAGPMAYRGMHSIKRIQEFKVSFLDEDGKPRSDLGYVFNELAENILTFTSWLYLTARWQTEPADDAWKARLGSELPPKRLSGEYQLLDGAYRDLLRVAEQESQWERIVAFCGEIMNLDPSLKNQVEPLLVRTEFRSLLKNWRESLHDCRLAQAGEDLRRLDNLFQDHQRIQICSAEELKVFDALRQKTALIEELRAGIDHLLANVFDKALRAFVLVSERTAGEDSLRRTADRLKNLAQHLAGLQDFAAVVVKVEQSRGEEPELEVDWGDLFRRLLAFEEAHKRLRALLAEPDLVNEFGRVFRNLLDETVSLQELLPEVDEQRLQRAIGDARTGKRLFDLHQKFLVMLKAADSEGARELLGKLEKHWPTARRWVEYLDLVKNKRSELKQIVESFEKAPIHPLEDFDWQALAARTIELAGSCRPLQAFFEDQVRPERERIGASCFIDLDEIDRLRAAIQKRAKAMALFKEALGLIQVGGFSKALDRLGDAFSQDPSLEAVRPYQEETQQAQALNRELGEIERSIDPSAKGEVLERLEAIDLSSDHLAYQWLKSRKDRIADRVFSQVASKKEKWLQVLKKLRQNPYVQGPVLGEAGVAPKGFHQILALRVRDRAHLEKIIAQIKKTSLKKLDRLAFEGFLDREHQDSPALLTAMGRFHQAMGLIEQQLEKACRPIWYYAKGMLHYIQYLNITHETIAGGNRAASDLQRACFHLLPFFFAASYQRTIAENEPGLDMEHFGGEAAAHLEQLVLTSGEKEVVAAFYKLKFFVQIRCQLAKLCELPFDYFGLRDVETDEIAPEALRADMGRIEKKAGKLPANRQGRARELIGQLRLLFSAEASDALVLFLQKRFSEARQKLPPWIGRLCGEEPGPEIAKKSMAVYGENGRPKYDEDLIRLQALIQQRQLLALLEQCESHRATRAKDPRAAMQEFRISLAGMGSSLSQYKGADKPSLVEELIQPIAAKLKAFTENLPRDTPIPTKFELAVTLVRLESLLHELDAALVSPSFSEFALRFSLGVSQQTSGRMLRFWEQNDMKDRKNISQFIDNVAIHERQLSELNELWPGNNDTWFLLGEAACMRILTREPGENIDSVVKWVSFRLNELCRKALKAGASGALNDLQKLKATVDRVQKQKNLYGFTKHFGGF